MNDVCQGKLLAYARELPKLYTVNPPRYDDAIEIVPDAVKEFPEFVLSVIVVSVLPSVPDSFEPSSHKAQFEIEVGEKAYAVLTIDIP